MKLQVASLGQVGYEAALSLQEKLLKLRQQGVIGDMMLLLEHPPVITIGRNGSEAHVIADKYLLDNQGVQIFCANRGGDVTYHGPGQIVGYLILDLKNHNKDISHFLRQLERTFIQLLQMEYGIIADRDQKHPGIWVANDKIVAIGCAIRKWVTMHGFAFNVNTDLSHYNWIIPCGIMNKGVTSLQKILRYEVDVTKIIEQVCGYFCQVFQIAPEIISNKALEEIVKENKYGTD